MLYLTSKSWAWAASSTPPEAVLRVSRFLLRSLSGGEKSCVQTLLHGQDHSFRVPLPELPDCSTVAHRPPDFLSYMSFRATMDGTPLTPVAPTGKELKKACPKQHKDYESYPRNVLQQWGEQPQKSQAEHPLTQTQRNKLQQLSPWERTV